MENYMLQTVGDIIESNLDCTSAALVVVWHQIENQTGLTLLAQFYDKQAASAAKNQSTTIFLRHLAIVNQDREASVVSLQLAEQGAYSTLPIHCSLLEARTFAWRTRIVSLQDSKTYPGPFVVVKVSRRTEDGLSIAVSPLLRIHNATDFSMKLRFRRTQQKEAEFAFIDLKAGDTVDDSMTTFRAIKLSGGLKKALMSASVGNFLLSFRPEITQNLIISEKAHTVDWSDELESGKAVRLSGLFDKLGYRVRKAFSVESVKCSFSTEHCSLRYDDGRVANLHFLIQSTRKDVPVVQPDGSGFDHGNRNTPVALQVQKEIFLLPTVRVSNLLHLEIHVHLTDKDPHANINSDEIGKPEIITCGSTVNLYANPASLFITVTLAAFNSSSKPVNSGDLVRKLQKQKDDVHGLNIELDFGGGKYCAILRDEVENLGSEVSPDLGSVLPPKSTKSWFMKYSKVHLKLLVEKASEALLDLDALSGLTEIDLKAEEGPALTYITRLGVSLRPSMSEGDMERFISVESKEKKALQLRHGFRKKKEFSIFENFLRKHRNDQDDSLLYIQFRPNQDGLGWSGPVCVASLGRFFLKFRRSIDYTVQESNDVAVDNQNLPQFAAVHVVEEGASLVLRFNRRPNIDLPYRIENYLHDASITFYQKGSMEPEILGSGRSVNYVWDDLTLPRKLVIQIDGLHLLREINLDKVRAWKPIYRFGKQRGLGSHLPLSKKFGDHKRTGQSNDMEMVNLGYEIYADGPTRVLRVCEFSDCRKGNTVFHTGAKMRLRISYVALHLMEHAKQEVDTSEPSVYTPIIVMRVGNINLDSVFTGQRKINQIRIQAAPVARAKGAVVRGTFKLISKCIDGKGFFGTKRYFGDLRKTLKTAGSNVLFAAVTEISDSVLKGAETNGFNGMVTGFHQGILKLAMEPSVLGSAFMEGGPDRKIKLDRNPGIDELYIEGYMQAMLDTIYKQEYLRVRVIDNQVVLKNLPPNSSLIEEIMDRVKGFLVSKALLKGDSSTSHSLRHLRGESEWKIGPTVLTLCEHLFVSFAIRVLRKQAGKVMVRVKMRGKLEGDNQKAIVPASTAEEPKGKLVWKWGLGNEPGNVEQEFLDYTMFRGKEGRGD
ncbi:hypothetical protein RJ640_012170 [Escallonia rubra]|uniref:Vacuolar protein sorting-associated protein 13 VPS13 adaptor binding domain-containing protein n=1 Tax=Escallonia rubra TaxID=112253 RepID=A0AA88UIT1_9ASTE|nr:hypothetical protein RJ640_012170 [Escallonia rubra]